MTFDKILPKCLWHVFVPYNVIFQTTAPISFVSHASSIFVVFNTSFVKPAPSDIYNMNFPGSLPCCATLFIWIVVLATTSLASSLPMDAAFDQDGPYKSQLLPKDIHTNLIRKPQHQNRQLTTGLFDARCEELMNSTIEGIFPRQDCSCEPRLFPPALDINCQLAESSNISRCFPPNTEVVCGRPGITTSLNLLSALTGGFVVRVDLCFYDATLFGFPVPRLFNPYCINILGSIAGSPSIPTIIQAIFGLFSPGLKADAVSSASDSGTIGTCKAKLGKKKCQSCSVCSASMGGGVRMDCSNLIPDFVVDECTAFPSFLG